MRRWMPLTGQAVSAVVTLPRGVSPGSPAAAMEHHESYLTGVLAFFGITDVTIVRAEGDAGETAVEHAAGTALSRDVALARHRDLQHLADDGGVDAAFGVGCGGVHVRHARARRPACRSPR